MCIHIYLLCALSGGEKHVLTADVCKQRLFNVIEPFRYVCVFSLGEYGRVCVCVEGGGVVMSIQPIRSCGTSGNRKRKMTDSLEKPFIIFYLFNLLLVWERRRRGWGGGPEILTSGLIIRGRGFGSRP